MPDNAGVMQHNQLSVEDLEALGESVDVEFKKAAGLNGTGEVPREFWLTYAAMANTEGGEIYLGVEEAKDGQLRAVNGLQWERLRQDIFNLANNRQKVSICVLRDEDVVPVQIGSAVVLRVRIPRVARRQRPVYVGENPLKGTYIRLNEGDFLVDEEAAKRMLAEQTEDSRDSRLLPHYGLQDLDGATIAAYRANFAARAPTHPFVQLPTDQFLRALNATRVDRETGEEGLTLAGLLMFGRLNSILEAVPNYILDYQERAVARTERRWVDRVTTDGSWSGNLFDFYTRVITKLTAELKVPFRNEGGVRQQFTPVHEALQEALVNTLIHADYSGRASVLVVKRPDMFGFRNPGLMRVPFDSARRGGVSDCRNRHIQKMFQLAGFGDQAGSGVPRILGVWRSESWREPVVIEKRAPDPEQTIFELRMASLLPDTEVATFEAKYGDRFRELAHDDKVVLVSAAIEVVTNHRRVCELTDQHPADVTKQLSRLSREGFLLPDGRGRGTFYWSVEVPPESRAGLLGFDALAGGEPSNSPSFAVDSPTLSGNSPTLAAGAPPAASSQAEQERLAELIVARYPGGLPGKLTEGQMRGLIVALLTENFVSLKQLSEALGRKQDFLRAKYLKPMLDDGLLTAKHPDSPNHPEQAYRTAAATASGTP
jgi:predicted HTH transcriptional regulator